jgi:hypothetical protein
MIDAQKTSINDTANLDLRQIHELVVTGEQNCYTPLQFSAEQTSLREAFRTRSQIIFIKTPRMKTEFVAYAPLPIIAIFVFKPLSLNIKTESSI